MPVSKGVDIWFCLFIIIESGERRESKPPGHLKSIIKPGIVIVKISGRNASKISFFPEALKTNLSQFYCCCAVAESCLTLQPHGLHHNRLTISLSLLSIMSIELVMLSNHLILCHPLLLLPSIFPSIRLFSSESVLHIRWPKYRSFSFSSSPYKEYSVLISFRIDWFDLFVVQGTLKSLLQHHSSKESILWCSVFFMVVLSHPYMTTGKITALTIRTFASKVISLLFNMPPRFVKAFLPRSNCFLILWLQSPSTVILQTKKMKTVTVSTFSLSICHKVIRLDAMILVFWILSSRPAFDSSFTLIMRLFSCSLLSAITVSSAYLKLLIIPPAILIPAVIHSVWHFPRCALHIR